MTPADKFYMNHKKECCNHDCEQGRNCPNRNPVSAEAAFTYVLNVLAGIGIGAFIVAIVIWSVK